MENASLFAANPQLITDPPIGYQTSSDPTCLVENPQFESGLSPWFPLDSNDRGAGTRIDAAEDMSNGTHYVKVFGRQTSFSGIAQDVTAKIEKGESYSGSVRARMADTTEDLKISLILVDDTGSQNISVLSQALTTNWSTHNFDFSVDWTGELKSARLLIHSDTLSQDFHLDQIFIPISGSKFRTELDFIPTAIQQD